MSSAEVVQVPDTNGVAQLENHDTAFHDLSKSTEDDSKHALNGVEAVTTEHNGHVASDELTAVEQVANFRYRATCITHFHSTETRKWIPRW